MNALLSQAERLAQISLRELSLFTLNTLGFMLFLKLMTLEFCSVVPHSFFLTIFNLNLKAPNHSDIGNPAQPSRSRTVTLHETKVYTDNDLLALFRPLYLALFWRAWERRFCRILFPGQMGCHLIIFSLMMKLRPRGVSSLVKVTYEIRSVCLLTPYSFRGTTWPPVAGWRALTDLSSSQGTEKGARVCPLAPRTEAPFPLTRALWWSECVSFPFLS